MPPMIRIKPVVYASPRDWGWVFLPELAEIRGLDPKMVRANLWVLSKPNKAGNPTFYWTIGGSHARCAGMGVALIEVENLCLYVPAGWVSDVLELVGKVARVVLLDNHGHERNGFCPLREYVLHPCRPDERAEGHFIASVALDENDHSVRP